MVSVIAHLFAVFPYNLSVVCNVVKIYDRVLNRLRIDNAKLARNIEKGFDAVGLQK